MNWYSFCTQVLEPRNWGIFVFIKPFLHLCHIEYRSTCKISHCKILTKARCWRSRKYWHLEHSLNGQLYINTSNAIEMHTLQIIWTLFLFSYSLIKMDVRKMKILVTGALWDTVMFFRNLTVQLTAFLVRHCFHKFSRKIR